MMASSLITQKFYPLDNEFEKLVNSFHFRSVTDLRAQMATSGAIISGSAALAMLHPDRFAPNDLDFYVSRGGYASLLAFVHDYGYAVEADGADCLAYERDTLVVLKLVHTEMGQEINIITVLDGHVVNGITQFHSTLVMNYIGWYGVVSLYPDWTMARKGLIVRETAKTKECFEKYKQRGFDIVSSNTLLGDDEIDHWCAEGPDCPKTERHLLDKHCAFLPFKGMEGNLDYFETVFDRKGLVFAARSDGPLPLVGV